MALEITSINRKFEGEIRFKGRTYGIPFTLPGDLVQFQLVKVGKRGRKLVVDHIEKPETPVDPGFTLVEPDCPHHSQCGGCRARHILYEDQLRIKTSTIVEKMESEIGISPEILKAPLINHYRSRMDFVVEGQVVGLRGAGDYSRFIDIEHCLIQKEQANHALKIFREILQNYPGLGFRRSDYEGIIKYVTIRFGSTSGTMTLTLDKTNREKDSETCRKFIQSLENRLGEFTDSNGNPQFSLIETELDDPRTEVSSPPGGHIINGKNTYEEILGGEVFQVPYDSFFQPNPVAFDDILDWSVKTMKANHVTHDGSMVDLYCGAGVLSSILARNPGGFDRVIGMDFTESAIAGAPEHFSDLDISVDFRVADLNNPPADLFENSGAPLLIADPPRAGISPSLRKMIVKSKPAPFFLYISCNPDSQIPDLVELLKSYEPVAAYLVDPYPHTPHLEQAVLLRRRDDEQDTLN